MKLTKNSYKNPTIRGAIRFYFKLKELILNDLKDLKFVSLTNVIELDNNHMELTLIGNSGTYTYAMYLPIESVTPLWHDYRLVGIKKGTIGFDLQLKGGDNYAYLNFRLNSRSMFRKYLRTYGILFNDWVSF